MLGARRWIVVIGSRLPVFHTLAFVSILNSFPSQSVGEDCLIIVLISDLDFTPSLELYTVDEPFFITDNLACHLDIIQQPG